MDVIYLDELDESVAEPINADTDSLPKLRSKHTTTDDRITLESATKAINARIKPIVKKKSRAKGAKLSHPIDKALFACYEDYVAALQSK